MKRVLIIGATGQFGSRLVSLLCREPGFQPILAGRTAQRLSALADALGGLEWLVADRTTLSAAEIRGARIDMLVDASGPFAPHQTNLITQCLAVGVTYVDLADNRAFVAGVAAMDADGGTIITGASSTPALSNAAAAALTHGWQSVDRLRVAISPANRQPRGAAVIASVLAGAGQPFALWDGGRWQTAHGWSGLCRIDFPHVGRRWASLYDAPDNDALVSAFAPSDSARFYAGLEHPIMHLGLTLLTTLVRTRLLPTLAPFAPALSRIADWMINYGNNRGGMIVEAEGRDAAGEAVAKRWWLRADNVSGPHVPVLPALATLRALSERRIGAGARSCTGFLTLDDFAADFARLGIATGIEPFSPRAVRPER